MAASQSASPAATASHSKRGILADLAGLGRLWPFLRADWPLVLAAAVLIPAIAALDTVLPLTIKQGIDGGILNHDLGALARAALGFFAIVVGGYLARAAQSIATALAVHRMIRALRRHLVAHVLSLKAAFHDQSMSGALVTRATGDFDNLSESLNMGVLTSVVDLAVLAGCVIGMFVLNWQLALTALTILPLVGGIVRWFSAGLKAAMLKARVKIAALNAFTQECFYGHSTIKLLVAERAATTKFDHLNTDYRDAQMSSVILDACMFAVLDGVASITVGLALWLVIRRVAGGSALSAGVLVAFVQYVQQLFEPIKQLGNKMAMLQGAFASVDRIFGALHSGERLKGSQLVSSLRGEVSFDHVSFSYGRQVEPVLKDLSFSLAVGESLALVGSTGGGKSTIVKLLAKMYDGYGGKICIDGRDISDLDPVSLRRHMAIVPQDIVLFDGSVAFNIGLGRTDITRERIVEAAEQVGAAAFIKALPGGYEHVLKEQGANLSHGQRQLIAFARALAHAPNLIILDEATSAVDPATEAVIQNAINRMLQGRTVIVIAHRLATVRRCDRILVIDKGRIVEAGRHDELLARRGAYFQLHTALGAASSTDPSGLRSSE